MKHNLLNNASIFEQKDSNDLLWSVKTYLNNGEKALRERHLNGASGKEIVKEYTFIIDGLIKGLYERFGMDCYHSQKGSKTDECALVAMGGYGRGELNPRSDIDLMLLYPSKLTPFIRKISEDMLYLLWDTGLDVGYSVRSYKECIRLAMDDLKTKTSILDSRFLTGSKRAFDDFIIDFNRKVMAKNMKSFVDEKLKESLLRHKRFGGSVYILEPNIKEGEGGLRDLHTALWIAMVKYGAKDIKDLLSHGLSSDIEVRELESSLEFLWRIRNDLHFHTKRKVDQLSFEAQERIARLFGFEDSKRSLGVEEFMRQYYLHANNINHHSSLIISRVLRKQNGRGLLSRIKEKRLDEDFSIYDGKLVVKDKNVFRDRPEKTMKAFEYFQSFGIDFDALTREPIGNYLSLVEGIRSSSEARCSFLRILNYKERVFETLQKMHTLRFLGRYIPEFEGITCRVQHDLYHIYTIDTHSLFAVRELESLRGEKGRKEFPLLSQLLNEIERIDLLFLSVLFHDIGKALGKGHASVGAELVSTIMERMGFPDEDRKIVSLLVKNHLLLANLAQYRDIHDTKLITALAKTLNSIANLNMLYLLTFADIRAVGPEVWTQWKGALFHELYIKVCNILEKGTFETEGVSERLNVIKEKLYMIGAKELGRDFIDRHFKRFPARYFFSNIPGDLKRHIEIICQLNGKDFILQTNHVMDKGYTEAIVCTYDTHGLFSKIAGVMASNNVNILGAQINTSRDGVALDVLYVTSSIGEVIIDESKWEKVEKDLRDVIEGRVRVADLVSRRKVSILDRKFKPEVSTRIGIDNEVSDDFTVIDIYTQDRIGLLYTITSTLSNLGLYIFISKISTKGDEAADVFYVKDIFGHKITSEKRLKEIEDTLREALVNVNK